MSIELITGVPGSGKTYFAANMMKKIYDKKSKLIITNVNLKIEHDEFIQALDVENLYLFAEREYKLFHYHKQRVKEFKKELQEKEERESETLQLKYDIDIPEKIEVIELTKPTKFDKDYIEPYINNYDNYLKASGLLEHYGGSYIFWDEAQNDLEENDPIWIRFFSYHRHFSIDIILITQDISLIHRKYRPFIHKFYFGQNASKRLISTTLKYKVYCDAREFEKFFIEKISLSMKKEIHDFYDSGEKNLDKSVFLKKMMLPVGLIIFSYLFYHYSFSKKSPPEPPSEIKKNKQVKDNFKEKENKFIENDKDKREDTDRLIMFNCSKKLCIMKNSSFVIPLDKFKIFAQALDIKILYTSKINNNYSMVITSLHESLYNDLMNFNLEEEGDTYANDEKKFSSPNFSSSTP